MCPRSPGLAQQLRISVRVGVRFSDCMCTIKCQWTKFWAPVGDTIEYSVQTGWCFCKAPTPQCEKDCEAERTATENFANNNITDGWVAKTYHFPPGKPYKGGMNSLETPKVGGAIACTKTITCD